jgi:hypothetical protein
MIAQDAATGQCEVQIAQISDSLGRGCIASKALLFNAYG